MTLHHFVPFLLLDKLDAISTLGKLLTYIPMNAIEFRCTTRISMIESEGSHQ